MENRQLPAQFRLYPIGADEEPATRPREQPAGSHRSTDSDPAVPPTFKRQPQRGSSARPPAWTPDASYSHDRSGTHRSGEAATLVGRWPLAGKLHRHWTIVTMSVLGVATVILITILTRESTTVPQASPTAGSSDADRTGGNPVWPLSSPPVLVLPGPPTPVPQSSGPSITAEAGNQAAVPGVSPTGREVSTTTLRVPAKPGAAPPPAQNATAYNTIQAEDFAAQQGVQAQADESGSGVHIGFISTGDWVRYDNVGFTDTPADKLLISASNAARQNRTGRVELRLDSVSRTPIGSLTIVNNGNWFAFTPYTMKIKPVTGVHTVYLTFTSNQNEEFANIDSLRFQH